MSPQTLCFRSNCAVILLYVVHSEIVHVAFNDSLSYRVCDTESNANTGRGLSSYNNSLQYSMLNKSSVARDNPQCSGY